MAEVVGVGLVVESKVGDKVVDVLNSPVSAFLSSITMSLLTINCKKL